jgi:hypothetical protein
MMSRGAKVEISRVWDGEGSNPSWKPGSATEVPIKAGPEVTATEHVHQQSGVALFSKGDVANFSGQFRPETAHTVLGEKWPNLRIEAKSQGADPPPLKVMATTVRQWMIDVLHGSR